MPVDDDPLRIAVSSGGGKIYLATSGSNAVWVIGCRMRWGCYRQGIVLITLSLTGSITNRVLPYSLAT
jgi:DNA-binding beta-propeller fold protein YncE